MTKQFFERTIDRNYVALVWGDFDEEKGVVDVNIGRSHRQRQQQEVFPNGDEGKHAVTHYEVLERFGYSSLVRCKLETGRTHQIRVHLQHIVFEHNYFVQILHRDENHLPGRLLRSSARGLLTKLSTDFVGKTFSLLWQWVEGICGDLVEH